MPRELYQMRVVIRDAGPDYICRYVVDVEIAGEDGSGYSFIKSHESMNRAFRAATAEVMRWLIIRKEVSDEPKGI